MFWKDQYVRAADDEYQAYEARSVADLVRAVQQGQFGQYDMIYTALAEQAILDEAGWVLFDVFWQDELANLTRCITPKPCWSCSNGRTSWSYWTKR